MTHHFWDPALKSAWPSERLLQILAAFRGGLADDPAVRPVAPGPGGFNGGTQGAFGKPTRKKEVGPCTTQPKAGLHQKG